MSKISVGGTITNALNFTNQHSSTLLRIAIIPLLLAALIALIVVTSDVVLYRTDPNNFVSSVGDMLTLIVTVPFITAWHRVTLLGRVGAEGSISYAFRFSEIVYIGYLCVVFAIPLGSVLIIALVIGGILYGGGAIGALWLFFNVLLLVAIVFSFVVWVRFSLVFPSVSVGARMGLSQAWNASRGNGWRILWVFLVVSLPLFVIRTILEFVGVQGTWTIIERLLILPVELYFLAVFISALSMIFRQITNYDASTFSLRRIGAKRA